MIPLISNYLDRTNLALKKKNKTKLKSLSAFKPDNINKMSIGITYKNSNSNETNYYLRYEKSAKAFYRLEMQKLYKLLSEKN